MKKAHFVTAKSAMTVIGLSLCLAAATILGGCDLFGGDTDPEAKALTKDGYTLNEEYGWYEKTLSETDGTGAVVSQTIMYNLTLAQSNVNLKYSIPETYNKVVFVGNSTTTYTDFSIVAAGRYSDLVIELQNFKLEGKAGSAAIDTSDVNATFEVTIEVSGTSSVKGGAGSAGSKGASYDSNRFSSSTNNPRNGGDGSDGNTGVPAIYGNSLAVKINNAATLTVIGGNGGNGGSGGSGEGGSMPGIGQSGHGGNGGNGGNGGVGIKAEDGLTITNNGTLSIFGGNGGKGGDGGDGGNNLDTAPTDRADHGGNGGNGGNGGKGGSAISFDDGASITVTGSAPSLSGGNGGNGGNGKKGGNSCKCTFQTSKGGTPGSAGNGGNGGDGGISIASYENLFHCAGGEGGNGGTAGEPGYNPAIGYGSTGSNGKSGQNQT